MYFMHAPYVDLNRDSLTDLPGPELVRKRLRQWGLAGPKAAVRGDDQPETCVHALMLGIRRFATINLAFGRAAGDNALITVASRLTEFAHYGLGDDGTDHDGLAHAPSDDRLLTARSGGANFLIIANQACSAKQWQLFAERLADRVAEPIVYGQDTLRISPRVVLLRVTPHDSADAVLDRLRRSLTIAKRDVGRRVVWADSDLTSVARSAFECDADLLKAIDHGEIEVVFQPQYAVAQGGDRAGSGPDRLSGGEALVRWNHPVLGRIGATALFAIAERNDHVLPLSRHIAEIALAAAAHWPRDLRLSLNVTPAELGLSHFAADLSAALRGSGFSPALLTLEVTEQAAIADIELASGSLAEMARQGVRIALDDFGAGFCNFQYLKTLPLHYLKLDRSMIDNIVADPRDLAVLRAIVAMARALGLEVIAEGIESQAQADVVAREGCAYYQGYFCSQPVAAAQFLELACEAVSVG